MQNLISEDDTAVFLTISTKFSQKIIYGKWFLPAKYSSVKNFKNDVQKIFGHEKWMIIDAQNFPSDCLQKVTLKSLFEIAKLSDEFGIDSVKGFYFMHKRAPSISEFSSLFQGVFDNEIEFVHQHLLKTGILEKLSPSKKQGSAWKKYLLQKRRELIPYQFTSLPVNENEVLIYQREGLGKNKK